MNEIEERNNIPSSSTLSKFGVRAVGFLASGIALMILNAIASSFWPGLIVGGLVCLFGFSSFLSKDPLDKKAGFIIITVGILTVLSGFLLPATVLLRIGVFCLLALGIWNGIKFFLGLKKRS